MDVTRRPRRILSASNNGSNLPPVAKGVKDAIKGASRPALAFGTRTIPISAKSINKPVPVNVEKPKVIAPSIEIPEVASISSFPSSKIVQTSVAPDCFDDQHKYLLYLERARSIPANFLNQKDIHGKMRYVLFDWMLQVQERFNLEQDTLHLAYIIVDRCLHRMDIKKDKLQLLGSTCLFIATKYEEVQIPHIQDFIYLAASSFTMRDITHMEREVFRAINFNMGYAYPLHFLRRYRYVLQNDDLTHPISKMFCDLFVATYDLAHKLPSVIAQVALYLAYYAEGYELPEDVYSLMGTTYENIKQELKDFIDPLITFCTSPRELTIHRKYQRYLPCPRLTTEQLERLRSLKSL